MGTTQSKDKMYCTRYLDGKGPPTLEEQAEADIRRHETGSEIPGGDQPDGQMTWSVLRRSLDGHEDCDTIQINYAFEDGVQTEKHPKPGQNYQGLCTAAYLPQSSEGSKLFHLLETAFHHRLLFTVATNSSGEEVVTWSDIPQKTMESGGPENNGYPDPHYLKTLRKLLKARGIK